MKQILLNFLRSLAHWVLELLLKQYMKIADKDKNGELSEKEIQNSIKEIKAFLDKYKK
jgi:CRISPR/Cas system-associated endonuclease Cas1